MEGAKKLDPDQDDRAINLGGAAATQQKGMKNIPTPSLNTPFGTRGRKSCKWMKISVDTKEVKTPLVE